MALTVPPRDTEQNKKLAGVFEEARKQRETTQKAKNAVDKMPEILNSAYTLVNDTIKSDDRDVYAKNIFQLDDTLATIKGARNYTATNKGNLSDEQHSKMLSSYDEIYKDLSDAREILSQNFNIVSRVDYPYIKKYGNIDTASAAKAINALSKERTDAKDAGQSTDALDAELSWLYDNTGAVGQAAKRRSEYAANKLALEQKKKEAAELGTKIGQSETADEGTASRVQALYAEIKDLEDKIKPYERTGADNDSIWLEAFSAPDSAYYLNLDYAPQDDPIAHIASMHPDVFVSGNEWTEDGKQDTSNLLTDDERYIYNYLLKNKGRKAAKEWLDSYYVSEERNRRAGEAAAKRYNEIENKTLRALAALPLSLRSGLQQFETGVSSILSQSPKATGVHSYAQQEATKDLGKVGKAVNDATVAIGNMAPSIAIGAINPVAGQISFGASAAGNAYNEARKEGKSIGEAAMYGLVSGGSELALQSVLGGIPVLSGGANKLVTAAKNLKNPAVRALSVYGLNALSEGTEEYMQDILDPVFRNVIFQEDNEVKILSEDAAYSFLLGAISAGALNIPSLARSIPSSRFGNGINVSGHTQNLIDNALKLPVDSEAYDLASKLKSGELKASDENVGEFAMAFARDGGDLSFLYERSGTVEEMAQKGNVVAEPIAEVKVEEKPASEAQTIVDGIVADGEITNSKAERIMDNAEALEIIGANTESLGSKSQKRAVIKEALRNYQQQTVAQRLANEVAQSTANFAADVQKAKAEQTDANTPSEAPAENATTYRYQYDVDKQRLGTRIIKDLGNTSAGGAKLSERLTEIATSVTGDKDANRAVYKLFANPRYAMMAGVEHTEDMRNIIRNIKDSGNSNFARRQMSNYIASTAAITEWTDLIRKDSNGVSLDKAAAMAPSNGKNAPDGYFDESEHAVVLNDGMVTYKRIISTLVHEGFHADGSLDRALVNNFSRYLENEWGKKDWDATVKDKKAKIEAYDGKPTTTVKAEEEVCAQVISELFNKPSAWEAMGEMFGEVEGSDRFVNRMKATVKRIFDNFRKKFGADIPNGKLTTFRDYLDTLLVKTQKGYTSVNETAKAPAKKETKTETKAATETKAQPKAAEEIDLDEDVGEDVDEDYYEGLTDEEREAVDLADEFLDGETKKTADGGRLYSSEDTEVDTTKISAEMSDMEREKILRGKTLVTPIYDAINDKTIEAEKESLSSKEKTLVKSALIRLGKEFSVAGDYKNRDLEVEISISNGTLKKTSTAAASVEQVARLLPHLQESVENAIAIEAHRNRYFHDANTIYFYEMISGYVDGEDFVPVRFGVKMSEDRNKLYVVVDGEKIKAEVIKSTMPQKEGTLDSRSAYAISLPRLFANVNSSEILKYVPDGFLSEMQKEAKYFALSEMVKHTNNKNDTHYKEALASGNAREVSRLVNAAAKYYGYTIKGYHGTSRADRVGNVFRPDRATSGPMAFFTDDKEVANNYARDKKDTSLAYDSEYDSYYTQFRVNRNGKNISVPELWNYLSFSEKNAIKEKAKHIKFDDDYENIIVDTSAEHGNGAWDAYTLNMHRGNALEALVDTWLETGDLYNREVDFLQVLDLVGIKGVEYRDPDARYEKTYETWLKIQKPFDTDNANQSFYDSLSEWIENHDMSVYERETSNADFWDKNNQTPESWLEKLSHDIENGTTNAWTVIPDFVTDYLKEQGYDGIKDKGGKGGGAGHTVWIPFSSNQIKSADPITYDDNGNIIPLSERFNNESNDIRYSAEDTDVILPNEKDVEIYQENVRLKAENEELKRQFKRTQVKKPKLEEVEHLASKIAEKFGLSEDKANEIRTRLLKEFYVPIANPDKRGFYRTDGGRVSPEQLALNLQSICDDIIESADISAEGVGSGASEEIAEAQEYLKDKKYIGAGEGAVSKLYNDLLVKFPELFPANKHMRTKDKIGRIDQIVHAPTLESAAKSINANASVELQNFLIKQSLEPQAPTYADRVDQRIADIMNKNINRASYYRRLIEQETHEAISAEMEDTHKKAMIVKMALRMTKMLTRPTKKNHIPDSLRIEIARALSAIDFDAKKNADGTETKKGATLSDMSAAVRRIAAEAKDDIIIADRASNALENLEAAQDAAVQIGDDYKEVVKALAEYSQELTRMLPDSVIQKMEKSEQRSVARAIVVLEEIEKYGSSKNSNAVEYVLRRLNLNTANILNNANEVMRNYATEYELEYLKERTRKLFDNYKQFDQLSASAVARYLAGSSAIRLVDLSGAALDSVYRAVLTLNKLVTQENNLLSSNILARKNELGKKAYAEVSSKNKTAFKKLLFDTAAGGVAVEQLEPATMFGILGPTFNELFLNVEHGVDKQTQINQDYAEYMAKILKNNGYSKKSLNETYHKFKLADGSELALSVGEMMSIYLTARQQDGVNHLVDGGIDLRPRDNTLGKKVKELVKPRQTTTYRLSEADVNAIISKLDEQQRKFADDISEYLSKDLASELNEVSMRLYGYRMFTNPKYFPLRVSSDTTRKNAEAKDPGKKDVQNKSLRNVGATQARKEKAGNRLNITDVFSMVDDHVSTMSTWAAYVEPLTDFEAVLNYRVDNGSSVVKALNEAYGYQVTKYYQDFINRVNGAKMGGDENLDKLENKLIGSARAAQTALNWAVILKQPTSYFRAGQYLGVVDLAKGATKNNNAAQKRMLRYSGLARMKELGYSDLTFGKRIGEMYDNSEKTRISNFEEWSAKGAAAADRITWAAIWSACETAVERDPAFGKVRNEEFYAEVNRRFNDVIMDTQVVRTSFTTPPALLKDSVAYKAMYGFKNEPFKQMNMIYRSINEIQSAKDSKDKLAMKTATRHLAGGLIGIALSTMLTNVIDTLAPIFRGWDDEDYIVEEDGEKITFANKLLKEYVNNVIWSSVALIPLGGDLAANIAQGYDAYSTPVGDLVENVKSAWGLYDTIFNEDATPGKRRTASAKAVIETASILGSISAIPTRTIIRDLRGLFTTAFRVFGLDEAEYIALTLTGSPDSAYYQKYIGAMLMECINRKDQEAVDYIVNDLKKNYGWSDKKVQNLIDYYAVRADTVDKILAEMREGKSVMTYDFSKYGTDIMGAAEVIEEYVKDDLAENKNRSAFYNPDLEHMQEKYYFPDIKDATKSTIDALVFNRDAIGTEFAVCASGKTIFEKASEAHKKGASFESFLETYLRTRAADSDKDFMGETVSLSKSTEIYDIINEVTKSETERKALYDVFKVSKTTQNEGIMASIVDAAIRKDDAAYEKATQDYFDNNEGAKTSDLNAAKLKYIEAEMMRLAKLSYDDPAKYETEVARYRNGKNSVIAGRFTEANMRAARNRWINDYTEELAEKLAKNANDSDKVKLIYAEAAKYGIDKAKLDARARKYANKK